MNTRFIALLALALFASSASPLAAKELTGKKVVVDPGHGGSSSPGATGIDGSAKPNESDFNLAVGLKLRTLLQNAGCTVVMTRTTDVFVDLYDRLDLVNAENPACSICIHCNSSSDSSAHGTETFWCTGNCNGDSAADQDLANHVQDRLIQFLGRTDRGVKRQNFVMCAPVCPAILGEMLFISNQSEFNLINSTAGQDNAAKAFFYGALDRIGVVDPSAPSALAGTAASANQINLSWTDNSGLEDSYKVEQATTNTGPWTVIATTAASAKTCSATNLSSGTTYYYRVRAYNSILGYSAYSGTASATTQTSGAPMITAQPQALTVNPGTTVSFNVVAAGNPILVYQWRKNGTNLLDEGNIFGATAPTLWITNAQQADTGSYSVLVTNDLGSAISSSATLAIKVFYATWGPNATSECDTLINSMTITSDNHNGTANNVGRHSTTTGYNEARPCFHWLGTGVNTPLNQNIVTIGGTLTHTVSSAYSTTASASVAAYVLTTAWPNNGYSDSNPMVTWVYCDYGNQVPWSAQGGDYDHTELGRTTIVATGSYTWSWTNIHNAGCGILMRNLTSTSDYTYRKTFPANSSGKASLTYRYLPPSGLTNSCVQNWNVIGTWPDTGTNLADSFLLSADVRGVSEADMAASTGATYNGQIFAPSAQAYDQFDALDHGWGTNCTGYGFVYVYYSHADNTNVYLGTGADERCKIWINGAPARSFLAGSNTWSPDMDFYGRVTLRQGWNRVLLKAQNTTGEYGWSLRFANADRSALGNCTFALTDGTPPTPPTNCVDVTGSTDGVWQGTNTNPNFIWSGAQDPQSDQEGVSGLKGYYYYWGTDPDGTSDTQVTTVAAYDPSAVSVGGTYYLRVAPYDYALNTAEWQTLYTFRYDDSPPWPTNAVVSVTQNPNGTCLLGFLGTPQVEYFVVASTNAAAPANEWEPVPGSTNTVINTNGLWYLTVTNDAPQLFYRSVANGFIP